MWKTCTCIAAYVVEIKLQFLLLSVITFILSVTISLEKIICWPLNRGKKTVNTKLATAKRWPRPLNRGGRWKEVSNTAFYWHIIRDFGKWPLNGGWPLNRGPTVCRRVIFLSLLTFDLGSFSGLITAQFGRVAAFVGHIGRSILIE